MSLRLPVLQPSSDPDYGERPLTRDQMRSRRPPFARAKSLSIKRLPLGVMKLARLEYSQDLEALGGEHPERPKTRAECASHVGPCPWTSCRWHLAYDVSPRTGALIENFPGVPLEAMAETCVLDVADKGSHTLEHTGRILNITRERVRQIETRVLGKIAPAVWRANEASDEPVPPRTRQRRTREQ
jgi:hypothetical protein